MKATLCPCGCGKPANACTSSPIVKVFSRPLNSPEEREQIIENVQIGSTFGMRMRAHLLFYGKDLATYAKKTTVTPNTTHFLHLLSEFLYEKCDSGDMESWSGCGHDFWDEFVSTYCPHTLTLSHRVKETERFLFQLTKFANWMDTSKQTSLSSVITPCVKSHKSDIILCEKIINHLLKKQYPTILSKNWDYLKALDQLEAAYDSYADVEDGLFEVTGIIEKVVVARHVESGQSYSIRGLPSTLLKPQLLIHGVIGKRYKETKWNWFYTSGAYPQQSKKYLPLHMETAETSLYLDSSFRN
jgi:hypothetical protein